MQDATVLVIDSDEHGAQALLADLHDNGFPHATRVASGFEVPGAVGRARPDVVLFNYHFDRPDEILGCVTARLTVPDVTVVAIAAHGPAAKQLREWASSSGHIHTVIEKPLKPGHMVATVRELGQRAVLARSLEERTNRLAKLLPEGALAALQMEGEGQEELFEAAVVFTDIRRSSELITRQAPRDFFRILNKSLSEQSSRVRAHDGQVVKYTGDGMMAVFRGMGRCYLAMRCAQALGDDELQRTAPFGIGVAEGLVLAGLVGDSTAAGHQRQYDVIGATVHLSARLCAQAEQGEVVATRSVLRASRLGPPVREIGPLQVRGFANAIDCVALQRVQHLQAT